jgi:uncharacterized protein YdaU (DUF1376 family)
MIIDCISFFRSDWCERLSPTFNGQELIRLLNKRVQEDVNAYKEQEAEKERKREEAKLKRKKEAERKRIEKIIKMKETVAEEPERVITQEDIEKTLGSFTLEEIV